MEIVSEPDLRSPEEARAYVQELAAILQYLGVCDAKKEEGSLRVDANVSIRPVGQTEFGVKTEVKNMNSTKALKDALAAEVERQISALESGEKIIQETRHFDEKTGKTISLRSKEEAHDYRYFPEPDLVPVAVTASMLEEIKKTIGELPQAKIRRYVEELKLSAEAADTIVASRDLADFFEHCLPLVTKPQAAANWIISDIAAYLNTHKCTITQTKLSPQNLASLIKLIDQGKISGKTAKEVITKMLDSGEDAEAIVKSSGATQISDTTELEAIIHRVIAENPKSVADYQAGKKNALGFLVGKVMQASQGRAHPGLVNQLLQKKLAEK
jgi:aspartyl-tRNA(Asn)/glutamyl-tRNA(Gln) amidotransferase subunit B